MTVKEKRLIENVLRGRVKNKTAMLAASRAIDDLRRKYGRVSAGPDSLAVLRQLRSS